MTRAADFVSEFAEYLRGRSERDLVMFTRFTRWFVDKYGRAYQMPDPITLVLDNSIIQTFKHRSVQPRRELHALAYTAFCRFVAGWSDRPTRLALSPFAIYEHHGRTPVESAHEAEACVSELALLLGDTRLPIDGIGFADAASLYEQLRDVHHDDLLLSDFVRAIDANNWQTRLTTAFGTQIPFIVAYDAVPSDLPLRYFDLAYVKHVLGSRIEQYIIAQSQVDGERRPISSGDVTKALAQLNKFGRTGRLTGLGDIDILQICDISRQFTQRTGQTMLGQTLDRGLAKVLMHMSTFSRSVSGQGGDEDGAAKLVAFMFNNQFAEEEQRANVFASAVREFSEAMFDACDAALGRQRR